MHHTGNVLVSWEQVCASTSEYVQVPRIQRYPHILACTQTHCGSIHIVHPKRNQMHSNVRAQKYWYAPIRGITQWPTIVEVRLSDLFSWLPPKDWGESSSNQVFIHSKIFKKKLGLRKWLSPPKWARNCLLMGQCPWNGCTQTGPAPLFGVHPTSGTAPLLREGGFVNICEPMVRKNSRFVRAGVHICLIKIHEPTCTKIHDSENLNFCPWGVWMIVKYSRTLAWLDS